MNRVTELKPLSVYLFTCYQVSILKIRLGGIVAENSQNTAFFVVFKCFYFYKTLKLVGNFGVRSRILKRFRIKTQAHIICRILYVKSVAKSFLIRYNRQTLLLFGIT